MKRGHVDQPEVRHTEIREEISPYKNADSRRYLRGERLLGKVKNEALACQLTHGGGGRSVTELVSHMYTVKRTT